MLTFILRILGLAPTKPGKSGKREAAWALMVIVVAITIYAMLTGIEMVSAMTGVLVILWPSAIGAMAGAYKLSNDNAQSSLPAAPPAGADEWPADIVRPEGEQR